MSREIKVTLKGGKLDGEEIYLDLDHIQYHRSFIEKDDNGKIIAIDTQVYLMGNTRGIRLDCKADWLSHQKRRNVDCSTLTEENFQKVLEFAKNIQ